MSIQLPGNARALLRDAVRQAYSKVGGETLFRANDLLSGRKINDLPKDDLLDLAAWLNIDVHALVRGANETDRQAAIAAAPLLQTPIKLEAHSDVTQEAATLRRELSVALVEGDFAAVTTWLETLIVDARKPAVVETRTVYVAADETTDPAEIVARPAFVPGPVGAETAASLFKVSGAAGKKKVNTFAPMAATPAVDPLYRFPSLVTQAVLGAFARSRHVWLYGPAGTGKTSLGEQIAARTGRPFSLIPCDDTTEAPELVGMTVPHQGGVRWQDGVLTAAIRVPHNIILIDEPTVARAGALMVLQSVLASGVLSIKETGEYVRVAEGVRFLVADNTNGTGGGNAAGYEGTRRMNRATLDRFALFLKLEYQEKAAEADCVVDHTGCTPALAKLLVECADLTRKGNVTHAIGLRRLFAWAEALTDGLDTRTAFEFAILNGCARDDREPIEQACALGLDKRAVKQALTGQVEPVAEDTRSYGEKLRDPEGAPFGRAAADFADAPV